MADPERRLRVIANPRAGSGPRLRQLSEALRQLEARGWRVERRLTHAPRDARVLAAEAAVAGYDAVLVCGGDGTINEAVNGLVGAQTALAVLPAGTVNVWAREAGLSHKPADAVRLVEEGDRRRVDLGNVNGRYFLMHMSVGADALAVQAVSPQAKERWGRWAFLAQGVRAFTRLRGFELSIECEPGRADGHFVALIIGNSRLYAGALEAACEAQMDDGLLDLVAYKGQGWGDLLQHVGRTLLGQHVGNPGVLYVRAPWFRVFTAPGLPAQVDGEEAGTAPFDVRVERDALTVIVPTGRGSRLFFMPEGGSGGEAG